MASVPSPIDPRRIIDVTAPLREGLVTWPGVVERFHRNVAVSMEAGDSMTVSGFRLGAHTGTHVDAPCHFLPGTGGVESLPLDALIGDAWVVRVPDEQPVITADVLETANVPSGVSRLLFKSRNSGWSRREEAFREGYVACDESAADWCLDRGIRLVGIDYLSIEPFDADAWDHPVHRTLLGAGVVIVESLELADAEPGACSLIVLPLLVPGSDGAPARAVLVEGAGLPGQS